MAGTIGAFVLSAVVDVATTSTAALVAGAIVEGVAITGLSYVAQSVLGPTPNANAATSYSTLQSGGILPQSFLFGEVATAGSLVYFNDWGKDDGTPNAYHTRVIALSDVPINALTGLQAYGKSCTYGSGTPDADHGYAIPEYDADGQHYLWVKFYDGTQTSADAWMVTQFGSDPNRPYTSSRVGYGRAYVIVTMRFNQQLFTGEPGFKFEVEGAKWYDPRQDSTAGGSGTQRWDDQSTWAYSNNPQLIRYNIRRGVYYGSQWLFGPQNMSAARLPYDNWSAAFDDCEAEVDDHAGGTERQYRCGGEVTVDTQPADLDESLMRACNGRSIEIGGIYKTTTGVIGSAVASYTDDDFIVTQQKTFGQYPGLSGTVNGITGHFPDPAQNWAMTDAPGLFSSDLAAEDGNRQQLADISYDCVPFAEQVQRNMKAALAEERRWRIHTAVLPHSAWQIEPGDSIAWTSTENGYDNKLFRVESTQLMQNRDVQITIREADPSDYDWTPDSDFVAVPAGNISGSTLPSQAMVGWAVEPATIYGDDGRAKPGIKVEWGTADIDDVDGVIIEIRLTSSAAIVWSGETPHSIEQFNLGEFIPPANLSADTAYQVRGKYRPISTRDTDWSSWLDVTTPDIRITAQELTDDIQTDLATVLALVPKVDATQRAAAAIRSLQDDVARAATALLQVQLIIPQLSQEFQRQLDASVQALTGSDVTDFAARLFVAESTIIDLQQHKATTTDLRALDSQINTPSTGIAALISNLQETVALLDPFSASAVITQTATAVRGQGIALDSLGSTVLQILQNLNTLQAGQSATLAYYRREISAEVEQGVSANAKAVGELGALMQQGQAALQASVTNEQQARVTAVAAIASDNETLLAAMSGYTAANAVANAFTSTNAAVSANGEGLASLGGDLDDLSGTVAAQATTISGVSSQVDRVRADGYVSIATQATPDDALARIALLVSATAGGSTSTAAIFLDALSGGDSRVIVVGSKFYVTDNTHVESLDSVLSFSGGVLTVPAARITGTLDVGNLIADNAIVGGQIVTGNTCKPFVAAQSGTVTASATVKTEILRKTCTSLGGVIQVLANFAQVSKADSGTYSDCAWELHHFSPGLSIGGGTIASGTYYANDSGELWRTAIGNFTGVYGLGDNFDVVLFITGDGSKRPNIGKSQFQILAFR